MRNRYETGQQLMNSYIEQQLAPSSAEPAAGEIVVEILPSLSHARPGAAGTRHLSAQRHLDRVPKFGVLDGPVEPLQELS